MYLKNWEIEANTGAPINGATVQAYVASDAHPNLTAPVATTATNLSGMWEFPSLADGNNYDIKVTIGSRVKWYKGNTKHNLAHLTDDTTPDPNRNLLSNGGQDSWIERGAGVINLPTADPGVPNTADGWITYLGSGDSGTAQQDTSVFAPGSKASIRIDYTRSGGQATHYRQIPDGVWQALKGKTVSQSFQVDQNTFSSELRAWIDDGVTTTYGTVTSVTGSWVTITVTKTISAVATHVWIGVQTNRADTGAKSFYVDNGMADLGSVAPVYAPEPNDLVYVATQSRHVVVEAAPATDTNTLGVLINNLAGRVRDIIGAAGNDWKDAVPRTLTQLIADKVAKAGDTISGLLVISSGGLDVTGGIIARTSQIRAMVGGILVDAGGADITGGIIARTGGLLVSAAGASITGGLVVVTGGIDAVLGLTRLRNGLQVDAGPNTITGGLTVFGGQVIGSGGSSVTGNTNVAGVVDGTTMRESGVDLLRVTEQAVDSAALGGVGAASYSRLPSTGSYLGDNAASRTIVLGFQPIYVLISVVDADPGAGVTRYLCHLVSTTVGDNYQIQFFPASSSVGAATMGISALAATGFIVGSADGNNVNTITYRYVAFR